MPVFLKGFDQELREDPNLSGWVRAGRPQDIDPADR
jgi:hypothetical protein